MPESPSSSFIPKRGTGKKPTSARVSNFFILPIISYALFVSAPLASAAIFIYERHTENQFNKAVVALDEAIVSFNEQDFNKVRAFADRVTLSKTMLDSHVSYVKLLQILESSTASNVVFKNIDIEQSGNGNVKVAGLLKAQNFDGALFQRSTYDASSLISSPVLSDVHLVEVPKTESSTSNNDTSVEFKLSLEFNIADIKYSPLGSVQTSVASQPEVPLEEVTDSSESPDAEIDPDSQSQDNI